MYSFLNTKYFSNLPTHRLRTVRMYCAPYKHQVTHFCVTIIFSSLFCKLVGTPLCFTSKHISSAPSMDFRLCQFYKFVYKFLCPCAKYTMAEWTRKAHFCSYSKLFWANLQTHWAQTLETFPGSVHWAKIITYGLGGSSSTACKSLLKYFLLNPWHHELLFWF